MISKASYIMEETRNKKGEMKNVESRVGTVDVVVIDRRGDYHNRDYIVFRVYDIRRIVAGKRKSIESTIHLMSGALFFGEPIQNIPTTLLHFPYFLLY